MSKPSKDEGLITVLLQRLEKQRLPRALALKEKVDQGQKLNEFDLRFLDEVIADANATRSLIERHHEYQHLAARMIHLYKEIVDKAMQNEQKL